MTPIYRPASTSFTMEARTPFGGSVQTLVDNSDTSLYNAMTSKEYMGHSYDPVTRRIYFSTNVLIGANDGSQTNSTAFPIYPSGGSNVYDYTTNSYPTPSPIPAGHKYDGEAMGNFWLCYKDIDTDVVTMINVFDSTAAVSTTAGVGSDGTWRMMVDSQDIYDQQFKLVDPRTGNVWSHATIPQCNLYCFEASRGYLQRLLPFSQGGHMELLGTNANWLICTGTPAETRDNGNIYCIPRVPTATELSQTQLLGYFSNALDTWMGTSPYAYYRSCWGHDGNLYFFGSNRTGARQYSLSKFTPPASVGSYSPGYPTGGSWTTLTPWTSTTGPNTGVSSYQYDQQTAFGGASNTNKLLMWNRHFMLPLPATQQLALLSINEPQATSSAGTVHDPTLFRMDCTYYNLSGGAFDFHSGFVTGIMTSSWTPAANLAAASYAVQFVREIDSYRAFHDYDYGDDYSYRWFAFTVQPVGGGTFTWDSTGAANMTILAKYHFVSGAAPVLVEWHKDADWLSGYTTFATAIGNNNVVEQAVAMRSELDPTGGTWGSSESYLADTGFYDAQTQSFWFGGGGDKNIQLNPAAPTWRGTINSLHQTSHPADMFIRLTTGSSGGGEPTYTVPIAVGCAYNSDVQILRPINPQEAGAQNGPALGKTRRSHQFSALVYGTQGVAFGTDFSDLHAANFTSPGGTPYTKLQMFGGVHWDTLDDSYSFDSMLCWRTSRPYPTTVLAVEQFVHTQDR